ncbi:hypothetical protein SGQ44_17030 [Flavobacterium sp. Fl-77]|uniref:Uncharacterized protein n=1 Tax=Flavobacterium flavipigmentatum TaxID=2893884 RepID=A0AAJ2W2K7_9FLAO|nr:MULTISPECIES: hypothetical protein [unclassified Flavobacterium]MDX6183969.1 hypothetical protein [Flavobacterium sp. Fl-33]MDX6187465.1 hypothetical protein [Flavobacterium sp. Fl-77]UFH37694.1 hypothetical protein LNP22_13215 [Flavobacterium sp. F-70]
MTLRKIRYKNIGILLILAFVTFCIIFNHYVNLKKEKYRKEFKESKFIGIITKNYRQKGGTILFYKNIETGIETELNPSDTLADIAKISDTIIKIENLNECIVKNMGKHIRIICEYEEK